MSATIGFPLLALVAGASTELVELLGRADWEPAGGLMRLLAVAGAVRAITLFTGPFLQSTGRPGSHAGLSWVAALLGTGAFVVVGQIYGDEDLGTQVTALANSRVIVHLLFIPMFLGPIVSLTNLTVARVLATLWRPSVVALSTYAFAVLLFGALGQLTTLAALLIGGIASTAVAGGLTLALMPALRERALALRPSK